MDLKLSVSDFGLAHLGSKKDILHLIKDAGFDGFDAQFCGQYQNILKESNYRNIALDTRKEADRLGLKCFLAHAPFIFENTKDRETMIKRSIEFASILGAPIIVVHPQNNLGASENQKIYQSYEEFAKCHNIKIALENMFNWDVRTDSPLPAACSSLDDFKKHMSILNSDTFVCCVDVGHAEMMKKGYASTMIAGLNNNVQALHIHDNDNRHDLHTIPFTKSIDFKNIAQALKKIHYSGVLNFEVIFPLMNLSEKEDIKVLNEIYEAGIKFRNLIEK